MSPTAIRAWPRLAAGILGVTVLCLPAHAAQEPPHSAELDAMIIKEAQRHGVPERLVRRVVMRESRYNPRARNHSFWGLMQISYPTAKSMGFRGTPEQLLNPLVNLTYAVPYLANAFVIAGRQEDAAVRLYAHGYYDAARHRGMLNGLRTADSAPVAGFHDTPPIAVAAVEPPPQPIFGIFGALTGPSDAPPSPQAGNPTQVASAEVAAPPFPPSRPSRASAKAGTTSSVGGGTQTADELPKKWRKDGGVTVLARGEQSVDRIAASKQLAATSRISRSASHHSRKNTEFASLDAPATAQAYAASPGDVAAPQAAIAQAITPAAAQTASAQADPTPEATPAVAPEAPLDKSEHTAKKRHAKATRKSHVVVAKADARAQDAQAPDAKASDAVAQLRQ